MFPAAFLPGWAQTASNYNPVSYIANVTRELVSGGFNLNTLIEGYALTGLIALATLAATFYQFRRVVR